MHIVISATHQLGTALGTLVVIILNPMSAAKKQLEGCMQPIK